MEFKTIASGSKGNCYHITDGKTELILEAGISFKEIQIALNYNVSKISGILLTHCHGDHSKSVKTFLERGKNVYMTKGTQMDLGLQHRKIINCSSLEPFKIGTLTVLPFDVVHDVTEPVGYLIKSDEGKTLLFMTDTVYCKYNFSKEKINIFAVECNYNEEMLNYNFENGILPKFLMDRVINSHMSLNTLLDFLKLHDLSECEEINLIHLSSRNSDPEYIFKKIAAQTGKKINIFGG